MTSLYAQEGCQQDDSHKESQRQIANLAVKLLSSFAALLPTSHYTLLRDKSDLELAQEAKQPALGPTASHHRKPWRRHKICLLFTAFLTLLVYAHFSNANTCPDASSSVQALRCHHELGKAKLERLLARQSRTPKQAVAYYKRKYRRDPPPGFEEWVQYALRNGAPIIDDFDQLEADLLPLRAIPAQILKARSDSALRTAIPDKVKRISIKDGKVLLNSTGRYWQENARTTEALITPIASFLPDVDVLVNWRDRHIVQGPTHRLDESNMDTVQIAPFTHGEAWDVLHAACPRSSAADAQISHDRPSVDICRDRQDLSYRFKHGNFNSDGLPFNTTLPVMSLGKFSTFQDIAAPPWCYGSDNYRVRQGEKVPPFADKEPVLYWRGSMTGIVHSEYKNWVNGHRQRIITGIDFMRRTATELNSTNPEVQDLRQSHVEGPSSQSHPSNPFVRQWSPRQREALSRLPSATFDVGFTQTSDVCNEDDKRKYGAECREFESLFPVKERLASSNSYNHRFLLDIDGNGMSCRFYRLLDGGGLVFKQTAWVEWHDDRLVPFVHYVPIDIDANELPQYLDMMINTEEGRRLAETIANEGQKWASTALRKIDLTITYYRLLLELANIYQTQ